MLIIVEGCDGTGKTTLVERLRDMLLVGSDPDRVKVLHRGVPQQPAYLEYTEELVNYEPECGHHVVCDRWHWGELVYGPLYRGKSELGWDGMLDVERGLRDRGAVVVWLEQDASELRHRFSRRGEDYLKDGDVEWVLNRYREVSYRSTLPVLRFEDPTVTDVVGITTTARIFERNAHRARF